MFLKYELRITNYELRFTKWEWEGSFIIGMRDD